MTTAALFFSTFGLVFCLGLQSQLVNNGHGLAAFGNSLAIGACNLVLFKLAPNATGPEIAAYLLGGPFGIVASMWAYHGPFKTLLARLQARKHTNTAHQPFQG